MLANMRSRTGSRRVVALVACAGFAALAIRTSGFGFVATPGQMVPSVSLGSEAMLPVLENLFDLASLGSAAVVAAAADANVAIGDIFWPVACLLLLLLLLLLIGIASVRSSPSGKSPSGNPSGRGKLASKVKSNTKAVFAAVAGFDISGSKKQPGGVVDTSQKSSRFEKLGAKVPENSSQPGASSDPNSVDPEGLEDGALHSEPRTRARGRNRVSEGSAQDTIGMAAPKTNYDRLMRCREEDKCAVFVDLDGTVISNFCKYELPFVVLGMLPMPIAIWKFLQLMYCLILRSLKLHSDDDFVRIFLGGLEATVLEDAGRRASERMAQAVHVPVVRQLVAMQRAGATVYVVTANAAPLVKHFVCNVLRFELGAATELYLTSTGHVDSSAKLQTWNVGLEKAAAVNRLIKNHGYTYTVGYGDESSDIPMLEAVDEATVVNAKDDILRSAISKNGWQHLRCTPAGKMGMETLETLHRKSLKVAIVGAGWSGIYACKYCLQEGLEPTLFESSNSLGGVWAYRPVDERTGGGTVFKHTIATASKGYMHSSDFTVREGLPEFLSHQDYLQYLAEYAEAFGLQSNIRLGCKVLAHGLGQEGGYEVLVEDGSTGSQDMLGFDRIIVCTGNAGKPRVPELFSNFSGEVLHSAYYDTVTPSMSESRVLIVGGGESASHIAEEVAPIAKSCVWSIRNGQWFQDRHSGMLVPADMRFSRLARLITGNRLQRFNTAVESMTGFTWGPGGSGVPEWQPAEYNVMKSWANKDRSFLWHVSSGRLKPKRDIKAVDGNDVEFDDGEVMSFDLIIFCTGFTPDPIKKLSVESAADNVKNLGNGISPGTSNSEVGPMLPSSGTRNQWYKQVFKIGDPSMARVGFIRPTIGSVPAMAEMQARWVAECWSGTCKLPSPAEMSKIHCKDEDRRAEQFPDYHKQYATLENFWDYTEQLHDYLQCRLDTWQLLHLAMTREGIHKCKVWLKAVPNVFESLLLDADLDVSSWAWKQLEAESAAYQQKKHAAAKAGPGVKQVVKKRGMGGIMLVLGSTLFPSLLGVTVFNTALLLAAALALVGSNS